MCLYSLTWDVLCSTVRCYCGFYQWILLLFVLGLRFCRWDRVLFQKPTALSQYRSGSTGVAAGIGKERWQCGVWGVIATSALCSLLSDGQILRWPFPAVRSLQTWSGESPAMGNRWVWGTDRFAVCRSLRARRQARPLPPRVPALSRAASQFE